MKLIISLVTRFIPRHYLQLISPFFLKIISQFMRGNKFEDPINGKTYRKLLPYGKLKVRENALAPDSMSLERHRLMWLFMKEKTNFFSTKLKLLHIAPEFCFIKIFKSMKNLEYTTADLNSPWADYKIDVHNIPFKENSFDVVICNHVLEHVEDYKKVMSELCRVMKVGSWGIFQVPIDINNPITMEENITSPEERERIYGQKDHLRLFGRDYSKKLAAAGFKVTEVDFIKELSSEQVERYALPKDEIIYFCEK
jgi:SAM-dependent methyltransferase